MINYSERQHAADQRALTGDKTCFDCDDTGRTDEVVDHDYATGKSWYADCETCSGIGVAT